MALECLIGIKFKDFVLMASDMSHIQSVFLQKADDDKIHRLSSNLVMAISGEGGDTVQFAEYIAKNVQLYKIRNGYELPPSAAAHFTRGTLATHLRSREPYFVNLLMGGFDPDQNESHLFYIDYLAASVPVDFYAFGYGGMLTLGVLDKEYRQDMTREEGYKLLQRCVDEIKKRFIVNLPKFKVCVISKKGIEDLPVLEAKGYPA
ncbi:Proteasome subunit beta type-2 [Armadillidium vulgare]|nr:Proteasome subunit beta type-2 [Armadillidium vulgare]